MLDFLFGSVAYTATLPFEFSKDTIMTPHLLNRRDNLLFLGAASLSLLPGWAQAQIASPSDAIDKSEALLMTSQRATKAYLAIALGVQPELAAKVRDTAIAQFDKQLTELRTYAPTPAIKKTYTDLQVLWLDMKGDLVGRKPSADGAKALLAEDTAVTKLANTGAQQLQDHSAKPTARLVGAAGDMRVLSQRIAKFYFASGFGVTQAAASAEVATAERDFLSLKDQLKKAPQSTQALKDQLELVSGQWVFLENAVRQKTDKGSLVRQGGVVWSTSETILQVMNSLVLGYAKLV